MGFFMRKIDLCVYGFIYYLVKTLNLIWNIQELYALIF